MPVSMFACVYKVTATPVVRLACCAVVDVVAMQHIQLAVCFAFYHAAVIFCAGLMTLIKLRTQSPGLITSEAAARIHATIVRISKSLPL